MTWIEAHWLQLLSPAIQFFGLILAAGMVVWQLRKQHKNALKQQRENGREALKLQIYKNLVERIRALTDAYSEAKLYAFAIIPSLESFQQEQAAGYEPSPTQQRVPKFSELHFKAGNLLADLIIEFECWSIAFPGLNVFKIALNAAVYDVGQSFWPLFSALLHVLPMDPPPGEIGKSSIIHPPPTPANFIELKRLVDRYKEAMDDVGCYIQDLTVEAQNNLLHGLFEEKVPARQPLDPARYKVISTEHAQALIRYFENETPWGKNLARINAEVMAEGSAKAVQSNHK